MSDYWNIAMNEILGENGVSVNGKTLAKIADQVEGAASVSMDYAAPTGDTSVEYTFEAITCPTCNGDPNNHVSHGSRISSKCGCSICKGSGNITIAREVS